MTDPGDDEPLSASAERLQFNVRRLRNEQGLTQEALAQRADIARAYLGRLETQGRNVSLTVMDQIASALEIEPRELLRPVDEGRETTPDGADATDRNDGAPDTSETHVSEPTSTDTRIERGDDMGIDDDWLDSFVSTHDLEAIESFEVEGVDVDVPQGSKEWQRRVMEDVIDDSPNRDAPEKTTYRLVNNLTAPIHTPQTLEDVFDDETALLKPLALHETSGGTDIPVTFHMLVAKGFDASIDVRSFTESSFLTFLTDEKGAIDTDLAGRLLQRFQHDADELGLAERFIVETLQTDESEKLAGSRYEPALESDEKRPPFAPDAAELFREGLRKLLSAKAPPADFFQDVNKLLSLHFGLYLPRLAWRLNASIDYVIEAISEPESASAGRAERLELGESPESRFEGRLEIRAPSFGPQRRVSRTGGPHETYEAMKRQTERLHFSLIAFHRLRRLTEHYVRQRVGDLDDEALFEQIRYPSAMVRRLQTHPDFANYLDRACSALSAIFIEHRLQGDDAEDAREYRSRADNGLDWFVYCLECYNRRGGKNRTDTRAYWQGITVVRGLLYRGADGIIHSRRGVGSYFELGSGLVPLMLVLTVGPGRKLQLRDFWEELERYGFHFGADERDLLLRRLKSMGLYERHSDAGAANYVRSLAVARES